MRFVLFKVFAQSLQAGEEVLLTVGVNVVITFRNGLLGDYPPEWGVIPAERVYTLPGAQLDKPPRRLDEPPGAGLPVDGIRCGNMLLLTIYVAEITIGESPYMSQRNVCQGEEPSDVYF